MPYKISGTLENASRVIIIKESDWTVESNTEESVGVYEVDSLESGTKTVIARDSVGEVLGFGSVSPISYVVPPGDRGVFAGGTGTSNVIDYITISSTGDATDFGDLTTTKSYPAATSNGANDRAVWHGKGNAGTNVIDYITISSTGDANDFGDMTVARDYLMATSNTTNNRGVFAGGNTTVKIDVMDYITISSLGDATDFGDLTGIRHTGGPASNGTNDRGTFGGGSGSSGATNVIDYITISTPGNATDFGDVTVARSSMTGTANA